MLNVKQLVDIENGTQSRRIFWDNEVYQAELEKIFSRCWLFLTHESLIPNPGDFVLAKMVEDEVFVARQSDGSIKAFLNICMHRGTRLCTAEAGNRRSFTCGYHGWTYGIDGELRGVPFEKECGERFNRAQWRLPEIPRVESYRGFLFGCMDPQAPPLDEYLGEMAWYMDIWANAPGGIEFLGPPSRSVIRANWKTCAENFVGDTSHLGATHGSALALISGGRMTPDALLDPKMAFQTTGRYGHGAGIMRGVGLTVVGYDDPPLWEWQERRQASLAKTIGDKRAALYGGHWNATIFPNCSFLYGTNVFKVWNPIGPDKVEVVSWAYAEKEMPEELKNRVRAAVFRSFGTGGYLESDDTDNMEYCNITNRGYLTRQKMLSCQMGLGNVRIDPEFPGVLGGYMSEVAYRGFYRFYAECLRASDWREVKEISANWKQVTA